MSWSPARTPWPKSKLSPRLSAIWLRGKPSKLSRRNFNKLLNFFSESCPEPVCFLPLVLRVQTKCSKSSVMSRLANTLKRNLSQRVELSFAHNNKLLLLCRTRLYFQHFCGHYKKFLSLTHTCLICKKVSTLRPFFKSYLWFWNVNLWPMDDKQVILIVNECVKNIQ